MKKLSLLLILAALLTSGCSTIYIVRHATTEEIIDKGEDARLKRYRIEGYYVDAFEHRAVYGSLEDAKESTWGKGIWLSTGISNSFDPWGRTREISKVKIEGTIWMHPPLPPGCISPDWDLLVHGLGVGHMGAYPAELVDVIVIEQETISTETKTEPVD